MLAYADIKSFDQFTTIVTFKRNIPVRTWLFVNP